MRLDTFLDEIMTVIKSDEYFDDIRVIKAYPYEVKPTRLKDSYIALGINQVDMSSKSIDSSERSGEITIFADIYVSNRERAEIIYDIFCKLCEVLDCYNIISIRSFRVKYDTYAQADVLKSVITFSDRLVFGGDYYE